MELRMPAADDFHIHLRNDERTYAAVKAVRHGGTARVLAMPNTTPAISNGRDAEAYQHYLADQGSDFEVLTTIKLTGATTVADIEDAARAGVTAVKQYPQGVTTNSEDGVREVRGLFPLYEAIRSCGLVLSIHGEVPGVFVLDAEAAFLDSLGEIHRNFPGLKIVLEHITTGAAVEAVRQMGAEVAATITDHHLAITLNDVVGSRIQPHHFCMPVAKRPEDRSALLAIVAEGHPRFFSGTDSAPHLIADKESACGCAGIFNSAWHMQYLGTLFQEQGILHRLENFCTRFGADYYGMARNQQEIHLIPRKTTVPQLFGPFVPFAAGRDLAFDLAWN